MKTNSKILGLVAGFGLIASAAYADISISVDAKSGVTPISPYIFGRNIDQVGDKEETDPETAADVLAKETAFYKAMSESGMHMLRANTGNNATRYNWRRKMTVHPDWYNNVENHDWDMTAKKIQENLPGVDALYAFQLTGYAAATRDYNFPDWDFYINHGTKWANQTLDLAGGGQVSDDGQTLIKAGDYSLYNMKWPADSTVAILDHWKNDLKYDMSRFQYWSMDNEMEIWANTHSDLPLHVTGDFLVERYVDVAKKARAAWPDIKLTGPVVANEWYWCSIAYGGKESGRIKKEATGESRDYCWLEYFIKKVAEEQKKSGQRLIDVFDIHWYPEESSYEDQVNWHRVFFDTTYVYPGANSIKQVNGGWDESIKKEFIFKRINDWLDQYFGKGHGITLALTETTLGKTDDAMTTAVIYASWLGTFMDHGVEIFTPWTWHPGMYETVHLFSRYSFENRVASVSSNDSLVSAYSSVNGSATGMSIILVNRAPSESQNVSISISNLQEVPESADVLTLSGVSGETFVSHTQNALKTSTATVSNGKISLTVPAKSITAVVLNAQALKLQPKVQNTAGFLFAQNGVWFVNNAAGTVRSVQIFDGLGSQVKSFNQIARGNTALATEGLAPGAYIVRVNSASGITSQRILLK